MGGWEAIERAAGRADARHRFRFFGGKGGAGKTTCAAATAVLAARTGRRILAVSTDPAHSLGDALGVRLGSGARRVRGAGALAAAELDADRALARWLGGRRRTLRTIAERGTYLDEDDIERLLDLSLPGVDELVGLLELQRLALATPCDDVVVDTAPTGHTLRLLAMPETLRRIATVLDDMQAKQRVIAESLGGRHVADAADRLIAEIDADGKTLAELLRDPERARFAWVMLPEALALEEAKDAVRALDEAGITVSEIVVNRVTPAPVRPCATCEAKTAAERRVIDAARRAFTGRALRVVPAAPREPRGAAALARLGRHLMEAPSPPPDRAPRRHARAPSRVTAARPGFPGWLDRLAAPGLRLLLFGGKGGVGKTTCAAAVALALARRDRGRRILLLSTDPAHSLGDVLETRIGDLETSLASGPPNLSVRELDATRAFDERRARYREAVDQAFGALLRGSRFDAVYDRTVVRELIDLAPPGLDELFGVLTIIDALFRVRDRYDLVIVDTAPTGHTLRLLRMPATALDWVRAMLAIALKYRAVIGLGEFAADLVEASRELKQLQALLAGPTETRFVPVTRAAELPRLETARLLRELARMRLPVDTVVLNAVAASGCPACERTVAAEAREIEALATTWRRGGGTAGSMLLAPAVAPPPTGMAALERWCSAWAPRERTR
ncbi:MAG: ArsA family ATPase [Candidatus Rokubacteria bacterium]|nr:ArsA family ATPase [Candidatus Rokubacteria bacterium]